MRVGDVEVMTIGEAAPRYGIGRKTLLTQIRRGRLAATKSGNAFLVTSTEMDRYVTEVKGRPGFAAASHPFHGRRPPRRLLDEEAPSPPTEGPPWPARTKPTAPDDRATRAGLTSPEAAEAPDSPVGEVIHAVGPDDGMEGRTGAPAAHHPVWKDRWRRFCTVDGSLYRVTRNGDVHPATEAEIVRWRAEGYFIERIDPPARWMVDAARDPRLPKERYRPLAAYLDAHVPRDEDLLLTFDAIETILGFALPHHRKRIVSVSFSDRTPAGTTWGMAGWIGDLDKAAGGVRFRRGRP